MTRMELAGDVWTIPAERMKAKAEHVVPLCAAALTMLPKTGEYILGRNGRKPINNLSLRKRDFNEALLSGEWRKDDPTPKAKPLPNWTLHDLRRTARSLMSRAGVPADVAERCLADVIPGSSGECMTGMPTLKRSGRRLRGARLR